MKIAYIEQFGGPEAFRIADVARPEIQADEILVRVQAAGVNFFEVLMRQDRYAATPSLPATFGVEVAGIVEAAGIDADIGIGSRVVVPLFALGRAGGYAEYVAVKAMAAVPLPDAVSFDAGVACLVQGLTALHAVRRTSPLGKSVLITAAGGGVGTLLVQLAKHAGTRRVVALAGSTGKLELALSLGADAAVNHRDAEWLSQCRETDSGAGFDIVYDFVGGDLTSSLLEVLAPTGILLFGALGRFNLDGETMNGLLEKGQTIVGLALLPLLQGNDLHQDLRGLFELIVSGRLKAIIGGRFPLEHVAQAHRLIESRGAVGKIVLSP
ncbi:quinone oxidoreductase family protein [Pseudochelatococcus sp. B33]